MKKITDGKLVASKVFADVFQAYLECSNDVQAIIREMVQVVNALDATEDEREAALATVSEALFPSTHNGALGMCLEECEHEAPPGIAAQNRRTQEMLRLHAEMEDQRAQRREIRFDQVCVLTVALAAIVGGTLASILGSPWAGSFITGGGLATLVTAFLTWQQKLTGTGKQQSSQESGKPPDNPFGTAPPA